MIDIKNLLSNFDDIKIRISKRNKDYNLENVVEMEEKRRKLIQEVEKLKSNQNKVSREVPVLKAENKDITKILEEMKVLSNEIKLKEPLIRKVDEEILNFLLSVPNVPDESVPEGEDETNNIEIRRFKEPTKFEFDPKPHWEIGENTNMLEPAIASKITGARFMVYRDLGARLQRAIKNFMLDTHTEKHGYIEVLPPCIVNRNAMIGTGQLPKFEEDVFKIEGTEYFLVPTAEVPVTNMYRDEILSGVDLTISHCAYTPCFRAEAGSAGRDTRGLIRHHQFEKVELVKFSKPENSYSELEKLTNDAEEILKLLDLPYRVVLLCGGDLGFSSAKTYDIEVWMPSYNRYVEISSCSNFECYQARRANIKFKNDRNDNAQYIHTLNGSGLAIGRTTAAILENYQQADGSVVIPDLLVPYMGGVKVIK